MNSIRISPPVQLTPNVSVPHIMFIHPDNEFDISTLPSVSPAFNLPRWSPASVSNGVAVGFRGGVLHCGGSDYNQCHHFDPARKANPGLFSSLRRGRFLFSMVILSEGQRPWVLGGIHRERLDGGTNIGGWLNAMQLNKENFALNVITCTVPWTMTLMWLHEESWPNDCSCDCSIKIIRQSFNFSIRHVRGIRPRIKHLDRWTPTSHGHHAILRGHNWWHRLQSPPCWRESRSQCCHNSR